MKYAYIQNNIAQEVVQSDPFMLFVEGYAAQFVEVPDSVFQGWRLVDGEWLEPLPVPVQVPQKVTRFQGMAAMLNAGILATVEAYMVAPSTTEITKLAWRTVNDFERNSQMVLQAQKDLGMTDKQVDDLFVAASGVK